MDSSGHPNVILDGASLTVDQLALVARDPRVRVECDDRGLERIRRCHAEIERIVRDYAKAHAKYQEQVAAKDPAAATPDLPNVYGVTTGFGEFKSQSVHPDDLFELQANILRSHATGVGDTTDPDDMHNYFPAEIVRAVLVLRLNTFLKGHSGVRPELALFIGDMINAGVVPLVPTRGSVGSSGDLCPLAHLFVVLLEEERSGRFYVASDRDAVRRSRGQLIDSTKLGETMRRVLGRADLKVPRPGYKEGLALTNGAAFSAAGLALAAHDARQLANVADVAVAMTLEATGGRTRALDEKIHQARHMRGQIDSAANLRQLLDRGRLADLSEEVQDVYSVRCAPQVHGASRDAIAYALMVAEAEINAATDNPLFFPGESQPWDVTLASKSPHAKSIRDRSAYSAGNFHGQPVGLAADFLAIALAELADVSERRTQMLLDRNHNRGLPACLTLRSGVHSGYMIAQYCAAGLVSENKVLCHPASVDSIPTSANSEDHVAMASVAARKLGTVLSNAQSVLAIELMVAAQALDWRAWMHARLGAIPMRKPDATESRAIQEKLAAGLSRDALNAARQAFAGDLSGGGGAALKAVRGVVEPLDGDRVLSEDIRKIRLLIEDGALLRAVEAGVGALRTITPLTSG